MDIAEFLTVHVRRRCRHCRHPKKNHDLFLSVPVRSTEYRCADCDCHVINGQLQPWVTLTPRREITDA